ncbi:FecR domain-containing protein [Pseudoxanthomonas wuyuanensis]|uniref:FecR domain-containing protein n=1 Tax=Pseudoxanthomonas wuyuanensis TaxID=1073196 RepID=UPI00138A2A41|nr:FecR domain-containing protein [Pseudoxanthomonas wuyuanensis]
MTRRTAHWRNRHAWLLLLILLLSCAPATAQDWTYRVRPGDTLWDLSGEYLKPGIPWQRLQAYNSVGNPYQLPPGSTLRFPLAWLQMQPLEARVIAVRGAVELYPGGTGAAVAASQGMRLGIGTRLVTAADASLTLELADGSRLLLRGDSELVLDRMSRYGRRGMVDTRLRLQRGRITNEVNPRKGAASFIVDTPTASSAVRGTEFRMDAGSGRTSTEVLDGQVAVSGGRRSALLRQGYGAGLTAGDDGAIRPVALLPAPALPALPALQTRTRPELDWPAVAGAALYRVQVTDQPDFETLVADFSTPQPRAVLPVLADGDYRLRVRAVDAHGLEGRDAVASFRVDAQPEPPFAMAPAADAVVRETTPTLRWTRSRNAQSYRYQVAASDDFAHPLLSGSDIAETAAVLRGLAPGRYYWRVGSTDAAGKHGPYGDPIGFVLQPLAGIDDIDRDSGQNGRETTFRWQAGEPGQRYRFQLSRSPDFKRMRIDEVVEQAQITVPRLRAGNWYLRVQPIAEDGYEGPFSATQAVEVPCRVCQAIVGSGALMLLLTL